MSLKYWRKRAGLSVEAAAKNLGLLIEEVQEFESRFFFRVPCCHLIAMVRVYDIPMWKFYDAMHRFQRAVGKHH